ncbi:MAG: hypothetical protein GTO02_23105, partial [Candidatus Dadabacteria bacterium]|nr:hypothetical protein [Candidatus Dadabacteria bacterium]
FNLVLFKDPIDYAWSFWKRGRGIETWRDVYKDYYKKYLSLDMPMLSVSYSELINDPEIKLRDIFNALDIHYSKGREKFWMNKSHHLFGNQMTTQQVEKHESYGLIKP